MNQRSKRAKDRRKQVQDIGTSTMQTGGYVTHHAPNRDTHVLVPAKTTGDITEGIKTGLAKASPFFKKLKEVLPDSKLEEQKAVAEATEKTDDKASKQEDKPKK